MSAKVCASKVAREMAERASEVANRLSRKADLVQALEGYQRDYPDVFDETVAEFTPHRRRYRKRPGQTGLTDAIRRCLRSAKGPLRGCEIARMIGAPNLTQAMSPQAAVGGCLRGLQSKGEARRVRSGWVHVSRK